MEFVSIGGLVKGITLPDIMHGISQSRNMVLANVFYRLYLIESRVLDLFESKKEITRRDVELLLGCSGFPARKILNSLLSQGKIRVTGKAKATKYVINP